MSLFDLRSLFGRSKLSALEGLVISAVSAKLSPKAGQLFNQQIIQVNLIQRHTNDREVNLYVMHRGKPLFDERFLFPLRAEALLATVELQSFGGQKSFNANVWLANGRVFSIEFEKQPARNLEKDVKVAKVQIRCNPMGDALEEELVDEKRRNEILAAIQSKVPDEYLQLVSEGKDASVNEWVVYSVPRIRKILQREENYYLLAEKEDMGAVGVKEGDSSGQIYYLDYGDDRGEMITLGFRAFLECFDGGKVTGRF